MAVCCEQGDELSVSLKYEDYGGFSEKHVPVNMQDVTSRNTVIFSRRDNLFCVAHVARLTLLAGGGVGGGVV